MKQNQLDIFLKQVADGRYNDDDDDNDELRVLVTGGRDWVKKHHRLAIYSVLIVLRTEFDGSSFVLVHGGARGADTVAAEIASLWGWTIECYPADWKTHGKAAGPIRNSEMVADGADCCLAFLSPESKGTRDCIRKVKKAAIPICISVIDNAGFVEGGE